jgi:HK97 family phage major capsid protein
MAGIEEIQREIAQTQTFVKDRLDPMKGEIALLREEQERLSSEVRRVLDAQRSVRRKAVLSRSSSDRVRVRGGRLDGFDMVDLAIMRSLLQAQQARPQDYEPASLRAWDDSVKRAMDSTTAGAGDELVSQEEARQLWNDVNVDTVIASLFETVTMPSNPFDMPLQLGDVNWYPGAANVATTSTNLATAKQTLTAHELVGMVPWAYELDEDAVIAMMAEVRSTLVRNAAQVLDDMILNADTSTTGNLNYDGSTLTTSTAGKAHYLVGFDGLVHLPLVDNTAMRNNHNAAASVDMFNEIRRRTGKYGLRPSELAFVTDVNTFIAAQGIAEFQTVDKLGPNATLLTGQLGAVEGIPVIVSEQMALADTDGKVTAAGNGTDTGRLLLVNRTQWRKGFKRELLIETDRDVQKRQNVMVVSMRVAFAERSGTRSSATHTALQYNVTGVA